ncbi:DUF433 domain-containing protein [Prosthecomicrobium sp. N25]|uniref:DUF433 domain-containing protein n=1 Tax=Prosthecomicrobium sp. N25 TaxID=3129254 RepID=UPI0030788FE6
MDHRDRISIDPDVMQGRPVIRGSRLTVEFVLGLMADGWTLEQITDSYPGITRDDLLACLSFARELVSGAKPIPDAA